MGFKNYLACIGAYSEKKPDFFRKVGLRSCLAIHISNPLYATYILQILILT